MAKVLGLGQGSPERGLKMVRKEMVRELYAEWGRRVWATAPFPLTTP